MKYVLCGNCCLTNFTKPTHTNKPIHQKTIDINNYIKKKKTIIFYDKRSGNSFRFVCAKFILLTDSRPKSRFVNERLRGWLLLDKMFDKLEFWQVKRWIYPSIQLFIISVTYLFAGCRKAGATSSWLWVSSGSPGFFPQPKNMQIDKTCYSKLLIEVNVSVWLSLCC